MTRTDRKAAKAAAKAAALLITDQQQTEWAKDFAFDDRAVGPTIPVDELLIWRHQLSGKRIAVGCDFTNRPNPIVWQDLVIASRFSPGELIALDRETGAPVWRRRLGYYGGNVTESDGRVLAVSGHRLLCYRAQDGRKLWEYIPYEGRETMYSSPTVVDDRAYIGDRDGYFSCLDIEFGQQIWSVLTSSYWNNQVNVTARVFDSVVVTGNNARFAIGVDRHSGLILWRRKLGSIITGEVLDIQGLAVVSTAQSVYALQPRSGEIVWRRTWSAWEIKASTCANDLAVVALQNQYGVRDIPPGRKNPRRRDFLSGCRSGEDLYRLRIESYGFGHMRYISETGHIASTSGRGVGLIQPKTGERLCTITGFSFDQHGMGEGETDLPTVNDGVVYAIYRYRGICALRYPEI